MVGKKDQAMPQQFDLTIGDTMEDIRRDTERELTEYTRRQRQKRATVREMVEHNLGPSHKESANPTYVDTLARQTIPRARPAKTVFTEGWNDVKIGQVPPKPEFGEDWNGWKTGEVPASSSGTVPSAVGAKDQQLSGKAVKTPKSQTTPYGSTGSGEGKSVKKPNELVLHMMPPAPETPAGMAPPPGGPPPPPGRGRIKKDRFKKPDPNLIRDATRLKGKQAAELARAGAWSKMDPEPTPEKLTPPRAASVPKAAKARAKSRSASRTPGAASSTSIAAAETTTVPPADVKPNKRIRSKSKPPIEVIVAPRPTRGRSIGTEPASRRIGSESKPPPIDPFAGPAQRLRSRTPAPKKTAAKEADVETGEPSGKSRKQEVSETAGKKPLKIPSKIKTNQIAEELKDLVKNKGWNQKDADRLQVLQKRVEDDPSTARDSSIEMQVIYKRNFNNLKKAQKA
jgi:hypothetical protein